MSTGKVVIHSNQLTANRIEGKILKNGDSVLVRISADKGNGTYEGFVGGAKVTIHSSKPLISGQTFPAIIRETDGVIQLNPKIEVNPNKDIFTVEFITNNQLVSLLESLGINSDNLSAHLFLEMKQMEMKIDTQLINKIRIMAGKYGSKSKIAAEILLLLEQKGIKASEEEILLFVNLLDNHRENESENEEDYTLLNRFNKKEGAWYLIPFNMIDMKTEDVLGNGFVNLLNINETLRQMNIELHYLESDFYFNVFFENKKPCEIKYGFINIEPKKKAAVEAGLRKIFESRKVLFSETSCEKLKGTGCENQIMANAEGVV